MHRWQYARAWIHVRYLLCAFKFVYRGRPLVHDWIGAGTLPRQIPRTIIGIISLLLIIENQVLEIKKIYIIYEIFLKIPKFGPG